MDFKYPSIFEFYNYEYFQDDFENCNDMLMYFCKFGYFTLAKILMETKILKSNKEKNVFFLYIVFNGVLYFFIIYIYI